MKGLKFLSVLLIVCASVSLFCGCGTVSPGTTAYTEGLEYQSHYDGTCSLVGPGTFEGDTLTIPDTSPDGDRVTAIGEHAFENQTNLVKVVYPYGILEIGAYAFYGCSQLEDITLPQTLTAIGNYAFSGCETVDKVYLGPRIKTIGDGAFFACNGITAVLYEGDQSALQKVSIGSGNSTLTVGANFYYYSTKKPDPNDGGNYWYYNNGAFAIW